jgi:hypothetical protein
VQLEGLCQFKTNYFIGNRTRDLPACSIVYDTLYLLFSNIFDCRLKRLHQFYSSAVSVPPYIASGRPPRKTSFPAITLLLCVCRSLTYNWILLLLHVYFRRNLFTEPLPSNELFRLSGVMSQHIFLK